MKGYGYITIVYLFPHARPFEKISNNCILVGYYDTETKIPRVCDIKYFKFEIACV
jgi:hypothetical protein